MKRKVRKISVNNQKFVWWYGISENVTTVNISPFHDKTSIISIKFSDIGRCSHWGEYNESIVMSKDDAQVCVKIVAPKMAGLLLSYIVAGNDLFVMRKTIILNGYEILSQMGYQIVEVKKGIYW